MDKQTRIAELNKMIDKTDREIAVYKAAIKQNELALTDFKDWITWGLATVGAVVLLFLSIYNGGLV